MKPKSEKALIDKILPVNCKSPKEFFDRWIEYLTPVHHLTSRERDVLVLILLKRYDLSKGVTDNNLIDEMIMNENGRAELREELNMSAAQLNGILARFSKLKILKPVYRRNGRISSYLTSPSLIPDFDGSDFKLLLVFRTNA